jgi:Ca2+-binding EF-hand superfamily protein
MNTKSLILLALSSALLPLAVQARPDGAPSDGKGKTGPPPPEQVIERLDTDQNGTISQDEATGPMAKRFEKIDANEDGEVDAGELKAARERRKDKEKGEKLKQADTDGNGAISYDEASQAGLEKLVEHFDKVDGDGDGQITKQEMRTMKKAIGKRKKNESE